MRPMGTFRFLALLCMSLTCSCGGELRVSRLDAQLAFDRSDQDGLIVLQVTPRTGVIITGGECDQHGWARSASPTRQHFWSADGYVVARATPTRNKEAYAVVAVRPERFTSWADDKPFTYATVRWTRFIVDRARVNIFAVPLAFVAAVSATQGEPIVWGDEDKGHYAYSPPGGDDLPTFIAAAGEVTHVGGLRVEASRREGSRKPPKDIAVTPIRSSDDVATAAEFMAAHYPNVHVPVTYHPLQMVTRAEPSDDEF